MLTPVTTLSEIDWQRAEPRRLSRTSHTLVGDLGIGAGGYTRHRYITEDGRSEVGYTVLLYIYVEKNPYENRVVPAFPGKQFMVADHAIRVLEVTHDGVRFEVLLPEEPLIADPRFATERMDNVIFGDTPVAISMTGAAYQLMILDTYSGQYMDIDGTQREGYLADVQLMQGGQVVEQFTLHRGFERTLPDGSYLRIFDLGERGITLGITPAP